MDAFEQVVASLLEQKGFWIRSSFKVELTKPEKVEIGRPSSPRWEIDLIAYHAAKNELWVVECKSYLDSRGVQMCAFDGTNRTFASRFKLFCEEDTRRVVFRRLEEQLAASGAIRPNPRIKLCLAAGKIASESDRIGLRKHFKAMGWELWDEEWIGSELAALARGGYQDDVAAVVAKLLLRKSVSAGN